MSFKTVEKVGAQLVAQEDLFLDSEQKLVVSDGDYRASFLLARKGQVVPLDWSKRLKLSEHSKPEPLQKEKKAVGVVPETRSTRPETPKATR